MGGATTVQQVSGDAELRARIEAQVAARRANSPSSDIGDSRVEDEAIRPPERTRASRSLTPSRPWLGGSPDSSGQEPDPSPLAPEPPAANGTRWRGVGPSRPWANHADEPAEVPPEPAAEVPEQHRGRWLRPARPWNGSSAAEPAARGEVEAFGPAPSQPDFVLRGMAAEAGVDLDAAPPPAVYVPDDAAKSAFAEAVGPLLDLPAEAP